MINTAREEEPAGELRYHRLLVAIDGSQNSELALAAAVTAARRDHAAVTLISVVPDTIAEAARWPILTACPLHMQDDADRDGERILRDAVTRIPKDIPVTTVLRRGRPGPAILTVADEMPYDAILLGARGVGPVRALMGSVSQYVLRHAKIAVFVAHGPAA